MAAHWSPKNSQFLPRRAARLPLLKKRAKRGDAGSGPDHDHRRGRVGRHREIARRVDEHADRVARFARDRRTWSRPRPAAGGRSFRSSTRPTVRCTSSGWALSELAIEYNRGDRGDKSFQEIRLVEFGRRRELQRFEHVEVLVRFVGEGGGDRGAFGSRP